MTAGADFVTGKGASLPDGTTHFHKNLNPFPTLGAFYFRQPGRSFPFLTTIYQHNFTSPNIGNDSVLHFLHVRSIAGEFSDQQVFLIFQADNNHRRIKAKGNQRIH